jgi:hypothetical protein
MAAGVDQAREGDALAVKHFLQVGMSHRNFLKIYRFE